MTSSIVSWIWSERFWLPENVSWADLEHPPPGVEYPRAGQVMYAVPLAFGVLLLRLVFERLIAKPCAQILHLQAEVTRPPQSNAVLEKVYASRTSPDEKLLDGLSKQLDWDVRKIQRWFRLRRNQDKPSILKKFCESMWRFTFYLGIFTYAIRYLWVSPWMWNTKECWYNYPFQPLSPGQYNYYVAELAFYWSLMLSQFTDIKRKDFNIMLVHHFATISLITFSYANNMLRAGTLVMCVHDAADIFLEAAKLANYAKCQRLCDTLFIVFSIVFFITRLVIYPFWIVHSVLIESWEIIGPYQSWWLLNGLLLVLQVLHVIWFYLIARIAIKALFKGKVAKDDRSDIESSSEEEADANCRNSKDSKDPGVNGRYK
ncbi:Ceramide synthase 5 [Merluccius polli]|uniref:Ceramide synthase 5 n=1 Tax=Merluccius polli TaxID=89951 RepID=A0AA47NBD2_MERPO|nr:Ceramide synthase 5 [Merluccius polli]